MKLCSRYNIKFSQIFKHKSDMDPNLNQSVNIPKKKQRNFPELQLNEQTNIFNQDANNQQPLLVIQSPKTPTLSRKLKAVSLDSDAGQKKNLDCSRDVSSVPNTPKKQAKPPEPTETNYLNDGQKMTLTPSLGSNLKRFASNQSISGSQTLKTLPEVMTLQEFSGTRTEPVRIKAKGLLERRGSNASLTIDLGSNSNLTEQKARPVARLNTAKSVSNLNLTSFGFEKCMCLHKCQSAKPEDTTAKIPENSHKKLSHSETCGNCTIYESIPSANVSKNVVSVKHHEQCKCTLKFLPRYYIERHCVCNMKCRRKSLSNENLYVPPCNFCHFGSKDCHLGNKACNRGSRKALYPRQTYIETSQLLSEDFKLHLQNVQYLQTAGSVLSVAELKSCCQMEKIPRLHQEFWEVPLNLQEKCLVSGSQSRNRYKGVLPNEHSRVHLPGPQPYIHANYIKGPDYTETAYIATQGPMSHTCEDFWNMVWSNKVQRIVMLTALIERGRNKCELYFPLGEEGEPKFVLYSDGSSFQGITDSGNSYSSQFSYEDDSSLIQLEQNNVQTFGPFTIKYISKENLGECIIRKLELSKNSSESSDEHTYNTRNILHYWYPNWADHKLANPEQVLQIALHVLGINNLKNSSASDSSCSASADAIVNSSSSSEPDMTEDKLNELNESSTKFDFDFNLDCKKTTSFESTFKDNNFSFFSNEKPYSFDGNPSKQALKFNFEPEVTKISDKNPIVVHCSAGIGRTGCFMAILNGIHQLRSNYNVDILAIVCSLRLNRGGMVQTAEQYELIHRVLSLYADII